MSELTKNNTENQSVDAKELYKSAVTLSGYAKEANTFLVLIGIVFFIVISTSPKYTEGFGIMIGGIILLSVLLFCWLNYAIFIFGAQIAKVIATNKN